MSAPLGPALLFCPADRPDRYAKAAAAADGVILDLEDAVAPARKAAAREALAAVPLDPATTIVRVNAAASPEFAADLAALARTGYRRVMLAKAETRVSLEALADHRVIALCESPLGVENAALLAAAPNVEALMWGAEDLVAALGGSGSRGRDGRYRDVARYARARVLVAAGAAGKAAYDAVHLDLADDAGLAEEAADAAASGFAGTACIHPRQVPIVRAAFRPSPEAVEWADRVLAAAEGAAGVFALDGRMVDEPLLRQARRVRDSARRSR
jgi:citrate lyase subunit beta/citryl-CoA lyase